MIVKIKPEKKHYVPEVVGRDKPFHQVMIWDTENSSDWYLLETDSEMGNVEVGLDYNIKRHYISPSFKGWQYHRYTWVKAEHCILFAGEVCDMNNAELVTLLANDL